MRFLLLFAATLLATTGPVPGGRVDDIRGLLVAQRYGEVVAALADADTSQPTLVGWRGLARLALADTPGARADLELAATAPRVPAFVHATLARLYIRLGLKEEFERRYGKPDALPEDADGLIRAGRESLQAGDTRAAERAFKRLVVIAPDSAAGWEAMGRIRLAQKDYARAWYNFRQAASRGAVVDRADWYACIVRRPEAAAELKRALRDTALPAAERDLLRSLALAAGHRALVARLDAESTPPAAPAPAPDVRPAGLDLEPLFAAERWSVLREERERLKRRQPGSPELFILSCRLAATSSEDEAAIGAGRYAVRLAPGDFAIRLALGRALWRSGRGGEALQHLRRARCLAASPAQRCQAAAAAGTVALSLGLLDAAELSLKEALTTSDTALAADIAYNLALVQRRRGEPGAALDLLDRFSPQGLDAVLLRAFLLDETHRGDEALALLSRAADASPVAAIDYGIMLRRNGRNEESLKVLRKLARLWPEQSIIQYQLGISLEAGRFDEEAQRAYRRAARSEGDSGLATIYAAAADRLSRGY